MTNVGDGQKGDIETLLQPDQYQVAVPIKRGATIGGILMELDLPVGAVIEAAKPIDLTKIRPDRELAVIYQDGEIRPIMLSYVIDEHTTLLLERSNKAWTSRVETVVYTPKESTVHFQINRSLWQDGLEANLRSSDLVRLANIFEYEMDFNSELRAGAEISLVADVLVPPPELDRKPKLGNLHAIKIVNDGKEHIAVRYVIDDKEGWYHPDGTGMKRPFLRSPLEFSRVTSSFNPKRYHPILKRTRPHNGTDFGAPTGTPVRAVADGLVKMARKNGGHGNFVKLSHTGTYATSYSHLSRIKVREGQRIKQGQIIGLVGSTGQSTGPHLHFQMWKSGKYVDAMRVRLPKSNPLPAQQRDEFKDIAKAWLAKLPTTGLEP